MGCVQADQQLMKSLAKGAVAAAEAQQVTRHNVHRHADQLPRTLFHSERIAQVFPLANFQLSCLETVCRAKAEIAAWGNARAAKVEAEGLANAEIIRAKGAATAERLRADGDYFLSSSKQLHAFHDEKIEHCLFIFLSAHQH